VRATKSLLVFLVSLSLLALVLSACGESTTTTTAAPTTTSVTPPEPAVSTTTTTVAQTTTTKPTVPTTVALSAPTFAGTIVFANHVRKGGDDICVVNTDGTGLTTLASGEGLIMGEPSWSPDGSKILYTEAKPSVGASGADIWVMNADGSGKKELRDGPILDGQATWSPDGTQIAWTGWTQLHNVGTGQAERAAIFVMNADGSDPHSITSEEGGGLDYWPMWANDGKIYFCRVAEPGQATRAYRVNPNGSGLEMLRTIGNAQIDFLIYAVSPDGTKVAFQDFTTAPDRLVVTPMSGAGEPVTLLDPVSGYLGGQRAYASWSPDGKRLAIAGLGGTSFTRLLVVNADGTGLSVVPGVEKAFEPSWRPQ
jgi:Tol biopolymer transport system component